MSKFAAIQMASGPNVEANLYEADRLLARAVEQGASLVVLPENFYQIGLQEQDKLKISEELGQGPITKFLADAAQRYGIWLVGGTAPLKSKDARRVRSACLVYNPKGQCVARYDKIHLFDVQIVDSGERYNESETIEPGEQTVVIDTPFGKLGLAICYDLRFPELFRQLLSKGAEIIAVPSAFTAITGRAHWETLVRARAIENLCYVIAAAQGGFHINGRETYGDSMIVGPWGVILDRLPRGSGVVIAEFDREHLVSTRRNFPAVQHRKLS